MSHLTKRVLPFTLTLATGLMLAALLGTWHSREWRHRYRTGGAFIPMEGRERYRRSWARRGCEFNKVEVMPAWSTPRADGNLPSVVPSTPVHVISYSNAGAIDGLPVSRDAVITNLPTPRFWTIATEPEFQPASFDLMLRVTLGSSGKVGDIEKLRGGIDRVSGGRADDTYEPPHLEDDIIAAARAIKFRPAMRGGAPVSQVVTIIYRQQ